MSPFHRTLNGKTSSRFFSANNHNGATPRCAKHDKATIAWDLLLVLSLSWTQCSPTHCSA